jgi:hypothetical protein
LTSQFLSRQEISIPYQQFASPKSVLKSAQYAADMQSADRIYKWRATICDACIIMRCGAQNESIAAPDLIGWTWTRGRQCI